MGTEAAEGKPGAVAVCKDGVRQLFQIPMICFGRK